MLTLLVGSSAAAPTCATTAGVTTCTFAYTGAREEWVVPAGVSSAVFDLYGAAGGSVAATSQGSPGGAGGKGAHVQATLAVTPGATLNLRVGGKGEDGAELQFPPASAAGGFNGGGTNTLAATCSGCFFIGGAGGGASDVRTSGDGLANRLLVAGAGGGGGLGGQSDPPAPEPGNGGDSETAAPTVFGNLEGPRTCSGGGAGTLLGPGAAGFGTGCLPGSPGDAAGGAGGGSVDVVGVGAGGGGFYGGGAGSSGSFAVSGGGGGSNFLDPSATSTSIENGVRAGNGLITITYTEPLLYNFTGFFPPVQNLPTLNVVKAGSGIAVKFSLTGNQGLDIFAAGYPASKEIDCPTGAPLSVEQPTKPAGKSGLSYNAATDTYTYKWKTQKESPSWKGTCRQLIVGLNDGTFHFANFKFK